MTAHYFNVLPPSVKRGDRVVYDALGTEREGVVEALGRQKGRRVVFLADKSWCYANSVKRVVGGLVLVVRAGDADDYHEFGTIREAAEHLRDVAKVELPAAPRGVGDMRVDAVNYRGNNYISMFWGHAADEPVRAVTPSEWLKMLDAIAG